MTAPKDREAQKRVWAWAWGAAVVVHAGVLVFAVASSWVWWDVPHAVDWAWAGAVTTTSFQLRVRAPTGGGGGGGENISGTLLFVTTGADRTSVVYAQQLPPRQRPPGTPSQVHSVFVDKLQPNTTYYYGTFPQSTFTGTRLADETDTSGMGTVKTWPVLVCDAACAFTVVAMLAVPEP